MYSRASVSIIEYCISYVSYHNTMRALQRDKVRTEKVLTSWGQGPYRTRISLAEVISVERSIAQSAPECWPEDKVDKWVQLKQHTKPKRISTEHKV
jgi:hypothetical protein